MISGSACKNSGSNTFTILYKYLEGSHLYMRNGKCHCYQMYMHITHSFTINLCVSPFSPWLPLTILIREHPNFVSVFGCSTLDDNKIHFGKLRLHVVVMRPEFEVHASSSPTHITTPWKPTSSVWLDGISGQL